MAEPQKEAQQANVSKPEPAVAVAGNSVANAAPLAPTNTPATPEELTMNTDQGITWKASEFHIHEKSATWYVGLAIGTIALAAILYLLTRSIMTAVVVIIGGTVLGASSARHPKQLEYVMNNQGIRIGSRQYLYDEFRLFVVTPASSSPEVTLIPTKRFMPSLSVRYAPDIEEKILSKLADHLPFEERQLDLIDSLMQRIRF